MKINYEMVKKKNACIEGLLWFLEEFGKDDVELKDVVKKCPNSSYARWLNEKFYEKTEIEKIIDDLKSHKHLENKQAGITVIGKYKGEKYILVWHLQDGGFIYGFKPINLIAYYDFGLGITSNSRGLKEYLEECEKNGVEIKKYNSLKDAL